MPSWLKLLWRHPLPFVAAFALGTLCAFAFSYGPLHTSKNWKIDYLEDRVDAQNQKIGELEEELQGTRAQARGRPDPEELDALRTELEQVQAELAGSKTETRRARSKVRGLQRSLEEATARAVTSEATPSPGPTAENGRPADEAGSAVEEAPEGALPASLPDED
jgi:chromosome segregation ATPase